ncbi:MAG: orotate phosphoribosyltransferase, partial [Candidatus Ratteibacteria bacterium]
ARVLQFPHIARNLAQELIRKWGERKVDVVIGPAIGGIVLSYALAEIIGARSIFAERENGVMCLRRGFTIDKDESVFVCEDVITTGGSVSEIIDLVRSSGAKLVGVCCLVLRGTHSLKFPVEYLLRIDVKNYRQDECPLCKNNIPISKPGSRFLK